MIVWLSLPDYPPEFTAKVVDRWQELENNPANALPNFADPAEAAIHGLISTKKNRLWKISWKKQNR